MNTIKINKANAKLIAHRGMSGLEAENTNSAFVAAGNRSYFGIETDIRRTSDGNIVINHDADLLRVAGEEVQVEESSLKLLQSIVHFDKDGKKGRVDLVSPTLSDYIGICNKYEKHSVVELKSAFTEEEILKIVEIIKEFDYLSDVTFISFNYDNLLKIRNVLPDQSVQFLFNEITDEITETLLKDKIDVDVYYQALTKENVEMLHKTGLKVNCWTVDNPEDANRLIDMGVDYITTNILE